MSITFFNSLITGIGLGRSPCSSLRIKNKKTKIFRYRKKNHFESVSAIKKTRGKQGDQQTLPMELGHCHSGQKDIRTLESPAEEHFHQSEDHNHQSWLVKSISYLDSNFAPALLDSIYPIISNSSFRSIVRAPLLVGPTSIIKESMELRGSKTRYTIWNDIFTITNS